MVEFLCPMSKSPKKVEKIQVFLKKRFPSKTWTGHVGGTIDYHVENN